MAERPLAGCGVAVTRPAHQAGQLCGALEAAGAAVLRFPTIEIRPLAAPRVAGREYDLIVYTSANAVAHAGDLLKLRGPIACTGPATGDALMARGVETLSVSLVFGTESLIERLKALEAMDDQLGRTRGKRILIVTGREGRTLLREAWAESGNFVQTVEVYERVLPALDPAPLEDAWRRGALHAVTVTSNATLKNLDRMLTPFGRDRLRDTQLVVASIRAVRLARELGIRPYPLVAEGADSAALVTALTSWWALSGPRSAHAR